MLTGLSTLSAVGSKPATTEDNVVRTSSKYYWIKGWVNKITILGSRDVSNAVVNVYKDNNIVGTTTTDDTGYFSIKVDPRPTEVTVTSEGKTLREPIEDDDINDLVGCYQITLHFNFRLIESKLILIPLIQNLLLRLLKH